MAHPPSAPGGDDNGGGGGRGNPNSDAYIIPPTAVLYTGYTRGARVPAAAVAAHYACGATMPSSRGIQAWYDQHCLPPPGARQTASRDRHDDPRCLPYPEERGRFGEYMSAIVAVLVGCDAVEDHLRWCRQALCQASRPVNSAAAAHTPPSAATAGPRARIVIWTPYARLVRAIAEVRSHAGPHTSRTYVGRFVQYAACGLDALEGRDPLVPRSAHPPGGGVEVEIKVASADVPPDDGESIFLSARVADRMAAAAAEASKLAAQLAAETTAAEGRARYLAQQILGTAPPRTVAVCARIGDRALSDRDLARQWRFWPSTWREWQGVERGRRREREERRLAAAAALDAETRQSAERATEDGESSGGSDEPMDE